MNVCEKWEEDWRGTIATHHLSLLIGRRHLCDKKATFVASFSRNGLEVGFIQRSADGSSRKFCICSFVLRGGSRFAGVD